MTRRATSTASRQSWFEQGLHFSCTRCGNCCTGPPGYVWFNDEEAEKIAEFLGITEKQFRRTCAHRVNGHWTLNEIKRNGLHDCIFLERDEQGLASCRIHPVRPQQCKTWPFWPENLSSPEHYEAVAETCPGMKRGLAGKGRFFPAENIRIIRDSNHG